MHRSGLQRKQMQGDSASSNKVDEQTYIYRTRERDRKRRELGRWEEGEREIETYLYHITHVDWSDVTRFPRYSCAKASRHRATQHHIGHFFRYFKHLLMRHHRTRSPRGLGLGRAVNNTSMIKTQYFGVCGVIFELNKCDVRRMEYEKPFFVREDRRLWILYYHNNPHYRIGRFHWSLREISFEEILTVFASYIILRR